MMIEQKNQTDNNIETTVDNIEQNSDSTQELITETEELNSPSLEEINVSLENQELTREDNDSNVVEAEFKDQSLNEQIISGVSSPATESSSPQTDEEESVSTSSETSPPESESESKVNYSEVIDVLQAEITKLTEQLEQEKQQHSGLKAQYARIVADFENFRRRTDKEKKEMEQQTKKKTINELLPVVDNFERARTQIKPANDGEMAIHKSYQGVYKNLVESLKKIGVAAMRPEGKPFDPNYHEAMLRESTSDYEDGIVMEQLVRGYLLNEEVLRYAMVKVAVRDVQSEESESQDQDSSFTENN